MDSKELRELIATSNFPDWYNSVKFEIKYLSENNSMVLVGIPSYFDFVNEQVEGWTKLGNLPDELEKSKVFFGRIRDDLAQFVTGNLEVDSEDSLSRRWNNARITGRFRSDIFSYNSPKTNLLLRIFNQEPAYFDGAYAFIIGNHKTNSKEDFIGAMLAYEFETKGISDITNRREKELESFEELRDKTIELSNKTNKQLTDLLIEANKKSDVYARNIEKLIDNKEQLFDHWFDGTDESPGIKDTYKEYIRKSIEKIKSLEEAYDEKLKLSKPARYWNLKSERYYKNFKTARCFLYIFIAVTAIPLLLVLMIAPDYIFTNVFDGNEITIVRWSLILIAFLALMAFAIRAVARVMFSSLHLSRDAEERHALTFVYLSLLSENGSEMTEGDRKLVLQSLFSRSDTGLLKNDSGPTMPNDILNKLINKS